jgi:hypothetical protein
MCNIIQHLIFLRVVTVTIFTIQTQNYSSGRILKYETDFIIKNGFCGANNLNVEPYGMALC